MNRFRPVLRQFSSKAPKAKKIPLDPNRPNKGANTAFAQFVAANFSKTGVSGTTESMKVLSQQWKSIDPALKAQYQSKADQTKVAYEKAKAQYDPAKWEAQMAADPKPTANGYSLFVKDNYQAAKG